MRLSALTVIRNEIDIISYSIGAMLANGVQKIYVGDNGSTDGTQEFLEAHSKEFPQIVVRNFSGEFHHEAIYNELRKEAESDGCDWIFTFDADELWTTEGAIGFASALNGFPNNAVLSATPRNFVVSRNLRDIGGHTPRRIQYYAEAEHLTMEEIKSGNRSYVSQWYPPKIIIKANQGIQIATAGHQAIDSSNSTIESHHLGFDGPIFCKHIPLRSEKALINKALAGKRLIDAKKPPWYGWQQQFWWKKYCDDTLMEEWFANSENETGFLVSVNGNRTPLKEDHSLEEIMSLVENRFPNLIYQKFASHEN